jgi:RNA polymerase sigma-70 factor (ECF subfamily)
MHNICAQEALVRMQSDLSLLDRYAHRGDADAFRELVLAHQDMVFATCRRVLGDAATAEDAAQEAFLSLARNAHKVGRNVGAWLHTTARHAALELAVRRGHARARDEAWALEQARLDEIGGERALLRRHLDEVLALLSEAERNLLVRHFLEGASQAELAVELGISQSMVSRRLAAALARLRAQGLPASACAALVPLVLFERAPPTLTRTASGYGMLGIGVTSGLGMGSWAAILGCTLCLLGGIWGWIGRRTTQMRDAPEGKIAATAPAQSVPPPAIPRILVNTDFERPAPDVLAFDAEPDTGQSATVDGPLPIRSIANQNRALALRPKHNRIRFAGVTLPRDHQRFGFEARLRAIQRSEANRGFTIYPGAVARTLGTVRPPPRILQPMDARALDEISTGSWVRLTGTITRFSETIHLHSQLNGLVFCDQIIDDELPLIGLIGLSGDAELLVDDLQVVRLEAEEAWPLPTF